MFNTVDFDTCLRAILEKVPPGPVSSQNVIRALIDHCKRVDQICSSEHEQRGRCRLLERAQTALMNELEGWCDTELPDLAGRDSTEPGESCSNSNPVLGREEEK